MKHLDKAIINALKMTTREQSADILTIISAIDAREKLHISYRELDDGLRRLIAAGKIRETKRLHFRRCGDIEPGGAYSGITKEEFEAASRSYRESVRRFLRELDALPEPQVGPLIVCRLKFPHSSGFEDESKDAAEDLAGQMATVLPDVARADVNGFEYSTDEINILIFGEGTNAEVDLIYDTIAPVFRAFPAHPGSCIIRHYDRWQREIESDLVTARRR